MLSLRAVILLFETPVYERPAAGFWYLIPTRFLHIRNGSFNGRVPFADETEQKEDGRHENSTRQITILKHVDDLAVDTVIQFSEQACTDTVLDC